MDSSFFLKPIFIIGIIILSIWDAVWKIIALWRSARNNHLVWFICIGIINSVGILPIVYILMHRSDRGASKQA